MGEKVERLKSKVDADVVGLTRIFIPPYVRVRDGKTQHVNGYFREIDSWGDLTPDERTAWRKEQGLGAGAPFPDLPSRSTRPNGPNAKRARALDPEDIHRTNITGSDSARVTARLRELRARNAHDARVIAEVNARNEKLHADYERARSERLRREADTPKGKDVLYGESEASTPSGHRPISSIASDIRKNWPKVNFGAKPYLDAMDELSDITDSYYADSAASVIAYFLSNASSWRGDEAKRIKAELKAILKKKGWG